MLHSKNFTQFHSGSNFKKYLTEPFIIPSNSSSSHQNENQQDQSIDQEILIGSKKLIDGFDPEFDRIIGSDETLSQRSHDVVQSEERRQCCKNFGWILVFVVMLTIQLLSL